MRIFLLCIWISLTVVCEICVKGSVNETVNINNFCDEGSTTSVIRRCNDKLCNEFDPNSRCKPNHNCCECKSKLRFLTIGENPLRKRCLIDYNPDVIEQSEESPCLELHKSATFRCIFFVPLEMEAEAFWKFNEIKNHSVTTDCTLNTSRKTYKTLGINYLIINSTLILNEMKNQLDSLECGLIKGGFGLNLSRFFKLRLKGDGEYNSYCCDDKDCNKRQFLSCLAVAYKSSKCLCTSDMYWNGTQCVSRRIEYPKEEEDPMAVGNLFIFILIGSTSFFVVCIGLKRCYNKIRRRSCNRNNASRPENRPQSSNDIPSFPSQISTIPEANINERKSSLPTYEEALQMDNSVKY